MVPHVPLRALDSQQERQRARRGRQRQTRPGEAVAGGALAQRLNRAEAAQLPRRGLNDMIQVVDMKVIVFEEKLTTDRKSVV